MTIKMYDLVGKDKGRPFSPHCWKSKMMFAHLGLDYETIPVRFTQRASLENGNAPSLPTICDGDLVMADSFKIAMHYAKDDFLMGGPNGAKMVKFVENWSQSQLHTWIGGWAMLDIHNLLDEEDQGYFRQSREKMVGKTLEEFTSNRDASVPELVRRLLPLKMQLSSNNYLAGEKPNFSDYIVFGAFQWLRLTSGLQMIPRDHPVSDWIERCLDLHDGLGRTISEAPAT